MRSLLLLLVACDAASGRTIPSRAIAVGALPIEVAAGDLDRDGRIDLVTAHEDGTVSVRMQRDGKWVTADSVRANAHLLGLGDIDGDGILDLVTTHHDRGDVGVFLGDGKGRFRALAPVKAVDVPKPHNHGLVVADLDGDGDADVVVADQTAKQLVILDANKTLTPRAPIALPDQPYPPAVGDLDRDGKPDIVVPLVGDRAVVVLLGKDLTPRTYATTRERPNGGAIGDVDGDTLADVVVSHDDTDTIVVMRGDGAGKLVEDRAIELPGRIGTPILADLDGDKRLDLAGAGSGHVIVVERGLTNIRKERSGSWRVVAADFDGNGKLELAAPDRERGVVQLYSEPYIYSEKVPRRTN